MNKFCGVNNFSPSTMGSIRKSSLAAVGYTQRESSSSFADLFLFDPTLLHFNYTIPTEPTLRFRRSINDTTSQLQYGQIEATTNHSGSLRMAHEPGVLQEDAGRVEMVTSMKGTTSLR